MGFQETEKPNVAESAPQRSPANPRGVEPSAAPLVSTRQTDQHPRREDDEASTASDQRAPIHGRRAFLGGLAAVGCGASATQSDPNDPANAAKASQEAESSAAPGEKPDGESIPRRTFGSTGETVSALGLGGYHIGVPDEAAAIRMMHRAIEEGMTFFDNCWSYHQGESERRMGKALRGGRRDQVFLMTKIDGRTREAAADQIDDCLRRLRVDHVDLMQVHEVVRDDDPEWVFGEDGAIEALRRAQEAGKIRYVGFTGHKSPAIHLDMLRVADEHDFRFDAVQLPLNVMDPHYRSFQKEVLPVLQEKNIAPIGMKPLASGAIVDKTSVSAEQCLRYALSLPAAVVVTGCDSMPILEQALRVGQGFDAMPEEEMRALVQTTAPDGRSGQLEAFKTTDRYDSTKRNPHWLTTGTL